MKQLYLDLRHQDSQPKSGSKKEATKTKKQV